MRPGGAGLQRDARARPSRDPVATRDPAVGSDDGPEGVDHAEGGHLCRAGSDKGPALAGGLRALPAKDAPTPGGAPAPLAPTGRGPRAPPRAPSGPAPCPGGYGSPAGRSRRRWPPRRAACSLADVRRCPIARRSSPPWPPAPAAIAVPAPTGEWKTVQPVGPSSYSATPIRNAGQSNSRTLPPGSIPLRGGAHALPPPSRVLWARSIRPARRAFRVHDHGKNALLVRPSAEREVSRPAWSTRLPP